MASSLDVRADVPVKAGSARQHAPAEFSFVLPMLRTGQYTLDIAVAEETFHQHVQHPWFHDATVIHVITDRGVTGAFALDTMRISPAPSNDA